MDGMVMQPEDCLDAEDTGNLSIITCYYNSGKCFIYVFLFTVKVADVGQNKTSASHFPQQVHYIC